MKTLRAPFPEGTRLFSIAEPPHPSVSPHKRSVAALCPSLSWFHVVGCFLALLFLSVPGTNPQDFFLQAISLVTDTGRSQGQWWRAPRAPWFPAGVPVGVPKERPAQEKDPEQLVQVEQQAGSRARTGPRKLSCLLPAPAATFGAKLKDELTASLLLKGPGPEQRARASLSFSCQPALLSRRPAQAVGQPCSDLAHPPPPTPLPCSKVA